MDRVNAKFLNDLITKIMTAAKDGVGLNINDADEVGQYVCAVLGLGLDLIPVVGSALGALCNLLGAVLFSPNSMENIWNALHERIEKLIDQKIEEYHLKVLKQKILGFQQNLDLYGRFLKDYDEATTAEEKAQAADTIKTTHIAFLSVLLAGIPEFQIDTYAVPSLPLFSLVATMHLTLLADGIKRGKEWGYSDKNIETMRAQFKAKTSPPSLSAPNDGRRLRDTLLPGSMLKDAIDRGAKAGIPNETLDTWKKAHEALYERGVGAPKDGDEGLDYVTYAIKIYTQGRKDVKLQSGTDDGYKAAANYRALSDYDTSMILNVLNYTELWPFMAGDVWTTTATKNLDREVFYGPYGRWADYSSWNPSTPPPITDRTDPITALKVRAWDDIDGVSVKHGSSWDDFQGNTAGGAEKELNLGGDEWVTSVDVNYGQKLGKLVFTTNKSNKLENGNARHGGTPASAAPPGYELTSVIITRWVGATPTGCEGVILGFRPLMTDTTRS